MKLAAIVCQELYLNITLHPIVDGAIVDRENVGRLTALGIDQMTGDIHVSFAQTGYNTFNAPRVWGH